MKYSSFKVIMYSIICLFAGSRAMSQGISIDSAIVLQQSFQRRHIRIPIYGVESQTKLVPGAGNFSILSTAVGSNVDASNLTGAQSETHITIDPMNPARILAGSNDIAGPNMRVFYSTNSGASFSATTTSIKISGTNYNFGSDPGVGFDLNGNAYYCYLAIKNDGVHGALAVSKSTTGGANWNTPVAIAAHPTGANPPFEDKCLLTVDTNSTSSFKNNIYVAWDTNTNVQKIVLSRSTDAGATFTAPVQVDTPTSSGSVIYACPAVGANGEVYVAWNDYVSISATVGKIMVNKSTTGGLTWGTDTPIVSDLIVNIFSGNTAYYIPAQPDRGIAACPSIDVDRSTSVRRGWVYATWCDASVFGSNIEIYFSRSTNGGLTWSTKKRVNDDTTLNSQFFPWISVDPVDGAIHIAWYDCRDDVNNKKTNIYYTRSTDGGFTFDANIKVTTVQSDESASNTSRDSGNNYGDYEGIVAFNGVAYPVWADTRSGVSSNGSEEVYVARLTNTSSVPVELSQFTSE